MPRSRSVFNTTALVLVWGGVLTSPAWAQSAPVRGGSLATYEAGYANGRGMEGRTFATSSRDPRGNRLIVNGIIRNGTGSYVETDGPPGAPVASGADYFSAGASTYNNTAIGNLMSVTVTGSWNTVIVNSRQTNTGTVTATSGTPPR